MRKIHVPITEQELQELMEGKKFKWVFDNIEITLVKEEEGEGGDYYEGANTSRTRS